MDQWMAPQTESETEYLGAAVATAPEPNFRAEFGSNLEANYPRMVAQLCMITLDANEAQNLVQEAYARAWQRWSDVRELQDPTGWVRQVAVRASNGRWRKLMAKIGRRRPAETPSDDPRHAAVLDGLRQIPPYRRRALVLGDVAQVPLEEIAEIEGIAPAVADARLTHARRELNELMAVQSMPAASPSNWEDM